MPSQRRTPDPLPGDRPRLFRAVVGALVIAVAVSAGLLPAVPATAQPSIEEIDKQLDEQWERLEPTVEQFNKVRSQLRANQKKAAKLKEKIEPLALRAELSMSRVGRIASRYYKSGPSSGFNALLTTGSASTLPEQMALLDHLAGKEREQIADVVAALDRYQSQKQELDELIAQQTKQDAELAATKKQIDTEMNRLQRLRQTAYGSGSSGPLRIGPCPAVYIGGAAGTAVRTACAQIGKPYVWGATGPGSFDCSGLTQYAWAAAGVRLTHFTGAQWNEGRSVSQEEARPGDLVFFYSDLHHVGVYVGNGLMVHAPQPGDPVQMQRTDTMPIAGFKRPS